MNRERHHVELRKYLAIAAARSRIRCGWTIEDAIREGARLHGLPVDRVRPWVESSEAACTETRRQIAAMTEREADWQPRKISD